MLTIALVVVALLPIASGFSMIGILPMWALCLLVGSFVLFGWNMGCALYYKYYPNDPVPIQTLPDEVAVHEEVFEEITNSVGKEAGNLSQLTSFWSTPMDLVSSSMIQPTSTQQNSCQDTSRLDS
jgi:hypothetical protein